MSYSGVDLDVREAIRHYVACGFDDAQKIYERITEEYPDTDEAEIDGFVDEEVAARDAAATAWPATTDCDRLDRAFTALDSAGVIARHNFACCNTCGHYEIGDQIAVAREARRSVDGYVFYHMQDTDRVVEGGGLNLRYGGTRNITGEAIGARIVAALRDAGLTATWNGDAAKTIEVAMTWRRRSPPSRVETSSAEAAVAKWCAALPAATLSSAAANGTQDLPRALDAVGLHTAALAWANAPFDDGDRACALARLAGTRHSPELLVEAWQLAPWDRNGTFVSLLAAAGMPNEQVRRIACDKIQEARQDEHGAAAAAWLAAVAPEIEPARERAVAAWTHKRDYSPDDALLAIAAGLWRAGDPAMRDEVISRFTRCYTTWAQLVAIAAAPTADDAMAFAGELDLTMAPELMCQRLLARLVELGAIGQARTLATQRGAPAQAQLAMLSGEPFVEDANEYSMQYEEGLITGQQLRTLKIAAAIGAADKSALVEVAAQARAEALAEHREAALEHLAGRFPEPDPAKLDAAIEKWQKKVPRNRRYNARRAGGTILAHSAARARSGHVARARELLAIVLAPLEVEDELDDTIARVGIEDRIVEAWVALGELERVAQYMTQPYIGERVLSASAIGCYVPALVASGDRTRAVELFSPAVDRARTRIDLLDLLPAALALGDAAQIHAAWLAADEVLSALALE